jgi:hypothetical protein
MKTRTIIACAVVAATAVGFTALAWNDNSAQEAATYAATHPLVTPTPAPTVTKTVTEPTKPAPTVTTEVASPDCVQALTDADAAIALAGEGFGILGDALEAAGNFDEASVATAGRNMTLLNKRLTVALTTYKTSRDACKAAGR